MSKVCQKTVNNMGKNGNKWNNIAEEIQTEGKSRPKYGQTEKFI
jgi:hypothetical protein